MGIPEGHCGGPPTGAVGFPVQEATGTSAGPMASGAVAASASPKGVPLRWGRRLPPQCGESGSPSSWRPPGGLAAGTCGNAGRPPLPPNPWAHAGPLGHPPDSIGTAPNQRNPQGIGGRWGGLPGLESSLSEDNEPNNGCESSLAAMHWSAGNSDVGGRRSRRGIAAASAARASPNK